MKAPHIVLNIPTTFGSGCCIAVYVEMVSPSWNQDVLRQGLEHQIVVVIPRPLIPSEMTRLAQEIRDFEGWCKSLARNFKRDTEIPVELTPKISIF